MNEMGLVSRGSISIALTPRRSPVDLQVQWIGIYFDRQEVPLWELIPKK